MTDSITEAASTGFEGQELEALRGYCERLDISFSKNHNATTLRKMLSAAMAEKSEHYAEVYDGDDEESNRLKALKLTSLNLRSQAGWQGRRRKIILHRAMEHESSRPQFMAWGRLHCYVPMGVECNVPFPIWNILQLTAGRRLTRKRRQDDEGRIHYEDVWVPAQRFMYTDMGDDPETIGLPTDMQDMIGQLYEATKHFANYSENQFREMCHLLMISIKPTWGAHEMRSAILERVGKQAGRVQLGAPDLAAAATG